MTTETETDGRTAERRGRSARPTRPTPRRRTKVGRQLRDHGGAGLGDPRLGR